MPPSVALCLTGSIRTLEQPCTLRTTLSNVVKPLRANLFLSVNVGDNATRERTRMFVHSLDYPITYSDVYVDGSQPASPLKCTDGLGWPQTEGLVRCMRAVDAHRRRYDYVIRVRTDAHIPFRIASLPAPAPGVAYVGFVGGRCNGDTAWWADDKFAILPTQPTQHAYMYGFGTDFCKRPCIGTSCAAPECKLGWTLATRNVTPIDLRPFTLPAEAEIVRFSCEATLAMHKPTFWQRLWSPKRVTLKLS